MFSLAGIPPLAGFMSKFYVFMSAIRGGFLWLAIIAIINSAIGCYYYIRVIIYMYFRDPETDIIVADSYSSYACIFLTSVLIVLITIFSPIFIGISNSISLY
jgi:NADH-quinone oxidoreductase subunit N